MPEKVTVIGAGGHARSVLALLKSLGYQVVGVMDASASPGETVMDIPVITPVPMTQGTVILAIGDNESRSRYFEKYSSLVLKNCLVHPGAYLDPYAVAGCSNLLFYGCYIGPEARLGVNSIINTKAVVEHEALIGDHTHISVGAAILGRAKIGSSCMVGAGAVVRDGVSVCDNVIVGANSYINRDIIVPGTYIGSPARKV